MAKQIRTYDDMSGFYADQNIYPTLAGLDRYRRAPDPDRRVYGQAVLSAIRALQARELARELPSHPCPCASGVWESDGRAILRAVRAQNRRA
jgi:hypothetical protein